MRSYAQAAAAMVLVFAGLLAAQAQQPTNQTSADQRQQTKQQTHCGAPKVDRVYRYWHVRRHRHVSRRRHVSLRHRRARIIVQAQPRRRHLTVKSALVVKGKNVQSKAAKKLSTSIQSSEIQKRLETLAQNLTAREQTLAHQQDQLQQQIILGFDLLSNMKVATDSLEKATAALNILSSPGWTSSMWWGIVYGAVGVGILLAVLFFVARRRLWI